MLLRGLECQTLDDEQTTRMETAEMRLSREVSGCRNINCIRGENISEEIGMAHISEVCSG
jgi:hypothetical protein